MEMKQFKNQEIATEKSFKVFFEMKDQLSLSARLLYVSLMAVDRDQTITHDQLAEITGLSVPTVKRSIKQLLEKELILQTKWQGGCFYVVL